MVDFRDVRVREVLKRPCFRNAEVIASEKALDRLVKWVHIMEVTKVGQLLNGNELILTTGIGWQEEEEIGAAFLRQLIESNAAGLCIELGTYTKKPPERMKQLAIGADFPLILFHEEVRYVDITRDLHTFFINRNHKMITDLDTLTNQFNRLLLSGKGLPPLLRLLHEKTKRKVALLPIDGEPLMLPPSSKPDDRQSAEDEIMVRRPIMIMGHKFAELAIQSDEEPGEFVLLALDRCATAVAQEMMRTMHVEERRRYKETGWIQDWLNGKLKYAEISGSVRSIKPGAQISAVTACVFELDGKTLHAPDFETVLVQRIIWARSFFDQNGFLLVTALIGHQLVFILLHLSERTARTPPPMQAIERLRKTDKPGGLALFNGLTGIGPTVPEPAALHKSFEAACETILIQKTTGPLQRPFYTELHVHRIIAGMEKAGQLSAFIDDYLGPILRYERNKDAHLLKTLKVYLQLSGAKQETANALFIVRQTLYHRLNKISELLGSDFTMPEKRLMIELALYAYEYAHGPVT
ncbi:PucR family transcriptional regulator [Paenibacillus alkalitolerans]|uniref:PucR family transcriptional regulator n=1 Tax=Paenibacillus alkalitolerans TaxID=2799335 RepID=UPI0018F6A6DB|nr:PucR family transcriptional regulator [Paenibacillus alkalitolerans]